MYPVIGNWGRKIFVKKSVAVGQKNLIEVGQFFRGSTENVRRK